MAGDDEDNIEVPKTLYVNPKFLKVFGKLENPMHLNNETSIEISDELIDFWKPLNLSYVIRNEFWFPSSSSINTDYQDYAQSPTLSEMWAG